MTYLWKFNEHSSRPTIFSPISTNARIHMPRGQNPTSCGTTVATALKHIDAIYTYRSFVTAVFLLSTSGSPDLSLARRFHFFAIILMAQKHILRPLTNYFGTRTNRAAYIRSFVINNSVLDHHSVPAEDDKARGRHAPSETRRNLFLAVS